MIENIEELPEFQRLLIDNPELLNLKDFFICRIEKILSEKLDDSINKDFIEKQDFDLFEKDLENIKKYREILKENDIHISDLELIEKLIMGQSLDEFREFLKEKKICDFINYSNKKNFLKLFELDNFLKEDLEELLKNENFIYLIIGGDENNFSKVWELYNIKTKKDLQELIGDYKLISLIVKGNTNNFNEVWELYNIKTKEDLQKLLKNDDLIYLIKNYIGDHIIKICYFMKNNYSLEDIGNPEKIKHNLFTVKSEGSIILDQLFTKLEKNKNTGMYDIMKNDVKDYLKQQNLSKKSNKIKEEEKLDISIYLRYGHTVNYPEIGEYIILFVDKYLQNGYSKHIKNIRIIPRNMDKVECLPRKGLFENIKKGKLYNVSGIDDFEKALKEGSIPFHLSHSTYDNDGEDKPYIISNSMEQPKDDSLIKASFDLERRGDKNNTHKMTLEDIFSELIRILEEVDNKIDLSIN